MPKVNNARMIIFTEFLIQCVLFSSLVYTMYFGVLRLPDSYFTRGLWVVLAVIVSFAARLFVRKFNLFLLSNVLVILLAESGGVDEAMAFNLIVGVILCAYQTSLKNREVRAYNDNTIPVMEGQSAESAREAAVRAQAVGNVISMYFIACFAVGYFIGSAVGSELLLNIQSFLCVLFVVLHLVHNNLKKLHAEYELNEKKRDFPASQMREVNRYVTIVSVILVSVAMLIFYNGYYGNIFSYIGAGFKLIIMLIGRLFVFLLGLSGGESEPVRQVITETASTEEPVEVEPVADNDFMELLAEVFGMVLIVILIFGIIYLIKAYAVNFNRTKKIGLDTVEYVANGEKKERMAAGGSRTAAKPSRQTRSVRKLYKKSVVKGMDGKKPDETLVPGSLTRQAITQDEETAARITQLYEKARYSGGDVSGEELNDFKKLLDN